MKVVNSIVNIIKAVFLVCLIIGVVIAAYFVGFNLIGTIVFDFPNAVVQEAHRGLNIANNCVDACVIITDGYGHGSGVHIGSGIILTAGHVVDINDTWVIAHDGRSYSIVDKWRDPYDEDIGFILIRQANIPCLKFGEMPNVMDEVTVVGHPLNLALSFNVTSGTVTNLHVDMNGWWYDVMIIDAATYPGNSGGPILNSAGEIIGILVGGYIGYDNLSICEPVENILWSLDSFIWYLKREY